MAMEEKQVMIRCEGLTKKYEQFVAVNQLSLDIYQGEIFGLLGPNGAGKTTTILMMMGLSEPTEGHVHVNGHNATTEPIQVKKSVGYLQDNVGFYTEMTAYENLQLIAKLNGVKNQSVHSLEKILERVGLLEVKDKKVAAFSRGMRQRLGIADILIKDPDIVIMDEPTLGLDPEGIDEILALIMDLAKKDGRTVIISSHLLYQMQKICDRVGIFVHGELLAVGPIETLAKDVFDDTKFIYRVELDVPMDKVKPWIQTLEGVKGVSQEEEAIILEADQDIRSALQKRLYELGITLQTLEPRGHNLEDIYRTFFKQQEVNHQHDTLRRFKRTH